MLLQTNSYIVPKDKRAEHARLVRRFRQMLARLGCEHFEVYEQVGANWGSGESTGRYVQIMRFRDRRHQLQVQAAERNDPGAQALITEFCELINFPYQQQQGLFAVGFYQSVLPVTSARPGAGAGAGEARPGHAKPEVPGEQSEQIPEGNPGSGPEAHDDGNERADDKSDDPSMVIDAPAEDHSDAEQQADEHDAAANEGAPKREA